MVKRPGQIHVRRGLGWIGKIIGGGQRECFFWRYFSHLNATSFKNVKNLLQLKQKELSRGLVSRALVLAAVKRESITKSKSLQKGFIIQFYSPFIFVRCERSTMYFLVTKLQMVHFSCKL